MRTKLSIPAVFLTALALGVWVGASWHSASQPIAISGAGCSACCRIAASVVKESKKTQISAVSSAACGECAACLAGALVYDAPTISTVALAPNIAPRDSSSRMESIALSAHIHAHPPERGPPA